MLDAYRRVARRFTPSSAPAPMAVVASHVEQVLYLADGRVALNIATPRGPVFVVLTGEDARRLAGQLVGGPFGGPQEERR